MAPCSLQDILAVGPQGAPRMGKVVKFTGSRLLGEELRRLRGGRTFDNIIELGRTKLVSHGFKAIARGTLCDIENGKALPNIESVFALSVLYQVPAARFIHFLLEENLAADVPETTDEATLTAAFGEALQKAKWTEALGLAIQAQRLAASGWPSLRWKLNHALAMEKLGMRTDAINVVNECLESTELPESEKHHVHRELSRMHASAGHLNLAEIHLSESRRWMPQDAPARLKASLLQSKVQLAALQQRRRGGRPTIAAVEEALADVREARLLYARDAHHQLLGLDLLEAAWLDLDRDTRRARKLAAAVKERAAHLGLAYWEANALIMLADLEPTDAARRRHLTRASDLAADGGMLDVAMSALVRLAKTAETPEQRAHYMRRCEKLYPLLDVATPEAREYERLKDDGSH